MHPCKVSSDILIPDDCCICILFLRRTEFTITCTEGDNYSPKAMYRFGEYWIYPEGTKNGLHAAGYNSAESEPVWMKFGIL